MASACPGVGKPSALPGCTTGHLVALPVDLRQNGGMTALSLPWFWAEPRPGASDGTVAGASSASRQHWIRSVDVDCPADLTFAWATQLRRAPYSYDLIDNFGRRSPQVIEPALIDIQVGDPVMRIFTVVAVDPGRSFVIGFTATRAIRIFGALTIEYLVEPLGARSRLVAQLSVPPPSGPLAAHRQSAFAWGDLVMMRKQLRELRRLAERDHRSLTASNNQRSPQP